MVTSDRHSSASFTPNHGSHRPKAISKAFHNNIVTSGTLKRSKKDSYNRFLFLFVAYVGFDINTLPKSSF